MGSVVLQYSHCSSDTERRRWAGRAGAGQARSWARRVRRWAQVGAGLLACWRWARRRGAGGSGGTRARGAAGWATCARLGVLSWARLGVLVHLTQFLT